MKVFVKNSEINLSKTDYLSAGGEGQIYVKGPVAYKLYNDPNKMIPLGKINELTTITDNNVICPKDVILDPKNKPIGYTMRFVKDTYALCQLFTRAFRERSGITNDTMLKLIKHLKSTVDNIHNKNILLVDLNEMNFLVNNSFDELYAIDCDSYMTPNYPATALMPSVKDWHTKGFNENSDWFSFGIVSFQMLMAIHPYKGKIANSTMLLDERMQKNISVFNSSVSIPKVCYAFDAIPENYKAWYKAIFEEGKRVPPPIDFNAVVHVIATIKKITGTDNLDIQELNDVDGNILNVIFYGGNHLILTDKRFYNDQKFLATTGPIKIGLVPRTDTPILSKIENGNLKLFNTVSRTAVDSQITCSSIMEYNTRVYVKNSTNILELDFTELNNGKIIVATKVVATVLENASKFYDGAIVQDLMGACYVSMFPERGTHRQVHIKELDGLKVIDAKFDSNVLMAVYTENGHYHRSVFRFSTDWASYDCRTVQNITPSGLNFVTLDNGVCVHLNEDENIEMFSNQKDSASVKVIDDTAISGDMKLAKNGSKLMFSRGNKLFSISLKKKP